MHQRQQKQQQQASAPIELPQPERQIYKVDEGIPSPNTRLRYRSAFSLFLIYCRQTDLSVLIQQEPRLIEARIIGYINFLAEVKHYARGSISAAVSTIIHFFEMNDVILNKKKISRFLPEEVSDHTDRAYTREEIQQLLCRCDERSRVIILLMASTGMRMGAIPGLQMGHLEKIAAHNLYKITVYANFPRAKYYCFCTPESAIAIDSYLSYRQRFGDPLNKTSPLVREQFEIDDPFMAANPKPIAHRTIAYIIDETLKRSGLKTKEVMRSHGFRKFAITMMKKARLDYSDREFLVGHRYSRGLDVNYDRTSEEDRLQEYLKAIDLLTISPENRLRKEIQDKDQIINHKLQEKDDALTTLSDQVIKLMAEVQELKQKK